MATKKSRKLVSSDVKQKAIERVRAGEKRAAVAKEIGVSLPTINNWLAAVGGSRRKHASHTGQTQALELLRLENEYLKKKIAYLEGTV